MIWWNYKETLAVCRIRQHARQAERVTFQDVGCKLQALWKFNMRFVMSQIYTSVGSCHKPVSYQYQPWIAYGKCYAHAGLGQ